MGLRLPGSTGPQRRLRSHGAMVPIVLAVLILPVACSEPTPDAPSGEVVLYTSMPDSVVNRLAGVIERRFPDLDGNFWMSLGSGISLRILRGRTGDIERLISDEMEDGAIAADVIWLADPSPYETYKGMGLLAPYEPPPDSSIPADYIDSDGFYVAGRVISMVIAWDSRLRTEGPGDWPDLLEIDRSAFPGPESGAARATIRALIDRFGPEFFDTLATSGGVSVASNGAARDGLVGGDFEAVAVLDYMARQAKSDGASIDFVYPASGTVIIPSPIAILADAPNPSAAKEVVDFILSQPGQEIVVELGSFYPARMDVAPPQGAPPLDTIRAFDVDWKALTADSEPIGPLWADFFEQLPLSP